MEFSNFISQYGEASKTAVGFFWKAGWAFVLGYFVSAMIQSFVPKSKLTKHMGTPDFKSISISTIFGAISSSCSFAALATARSLLLKGAHFISSVAFMFASTNLVVELGILIFIFLGWQFLAAEIVGGLILIAISSFLIKVTYPKKWIQNAREKVEEETEEDKDYFNWKKRIKSKAGWLMVGNKFVMEWKMVWQEILIGFTIAGFIAVFVPDGVWAKIFLTNYDGALPEWLIIVENAIVAPFVAAFTFIGSMGNIPLATVLNANGVLFAGIIGFIYSDLMIPPLVKVNAKYYGWKVAIYISGVMLISIVITALLLHYVFTFLSIIPESGDSVTEITQFKINYTFWMNLFFLILASFLIYLYKKDEQTNSDSDKNWLNIKMIITCFFILVLLTGLSVNFLF